MGIDFAFLYDFFLWDLGTVPTGIFCFVYYLKHDTIIWPNGCMYIHIMNFWREKLIPYGQIDQGKLLSPNLTSAINLKIW